MSVPRGAREYVYETIAQSVSRKLTSHEQLPMSTDVRYSKQIEDPSMHLHCEGRHIYVDLWHGASNEQWGYSLWSGCGKDSQFARDQLPAGTGESTIASVEPLAQDIASSLRQAVKTGCFTRHC